MAKISLNDLKEGTGTAPNIDQPPVEEPIVETPIVEEPIVETPIAETPEVTPVEAPTEEPIVEEPKVEQFSFAQLNETFNKQYESLDQVKADLDKPTMESEYNEVKTKYDDLQKTNELLLEQLDPASYFSSEGAMKLEQFKKTNPDKDAAVAQKVFSTEDLSSIDDLDIVKMGRKFKNSNLPGNDADLEEAIKADLGIDPDLALNEWSNSDKIRLANLAGDYREAFKQAKASVTLPEKVNIEELKTQRTEAATKLQAELTEGWGKTAEEALKSTSKLNIPIGTPAEGEEQQFFEWELGAAPKEEVEALKESYINFGMEVSEETTQLFAQSLKMSLMEKNLPQIMKKYADDVSARLKEEFLEKSHNAAPLKDSQRTEPSANDAAVKERTAYATEGMGRIAHNHPLFKLQT